MPAITWEYLDKGSSPIDWCEENYVVSPYIAEFVNTFSNIFFFIFPPLLINLHTNYAKYQGQGKDCTLSVIMPGTILQVSMLSGYY